MLTRETLEKVMGELTSARDHADKTLAEVMAGQEQAMVKLAAARAYIATTEAITRVRELYTSMGIRPV